jgi:hypothetical protein
MTSKQISKVFITEITENIVEKAYFFIDIVKKLYT